MFKNKIRKICPQMFNYLIKRDIPQRLKDITWTRYSIKIEGYNMKQIFHKDRRILNGRDIPSRLKDIT